LSLLRLWLWHLPGYQRWKDNWAGTLERAEHGGDRYDGIPVLINNPEELLETAGSLHCSPVNIARFLKEYLGGVASLKITVAVKPCNAKAIIELAKRKQITLDDLLLIGVNCTGTLLPARAKKMMKEEYRVDPADVIAEDIEDGKLIISSTDGTEKEPNLADLSTFIPTGRACTILGRYWLWYTCCDFILERGIYQSLTSD